ncbi:hypothetical protein [uncultured Tenacibaculum sp.]|uniref:hypothetical protein n=1 Tax=uncultured Tenacibaculum sp. TaxID=174713 RepID=UPI00262BA4FB|nr:hypothetical protein [uncultured Tenacibaculum sp.]
MKHIYKQLALLIFILGSTALQAQFLTPEGTDEFLGGGSNGGTGGDVIIKLPINNRCDGCENLEDLVFSNSSSLNNAIANDLRIEAAAREEAEEWYKKQTVIMHNFLNNFLGRNFSNYNEAKTELFKKSEQRNISYTQPIVERKFDQLRNSAAIAKRRSLYGLRALQQREREIRSGNTSNSLYSDILVNDIPLRNITDLSTLNRERNKILSDGFNRKMYEEHQYKFLFDLLGSRNSFRSDLEAETLRRKNQIHDSYNFWDRLNYMQLLIQTELIKRNGVSTVPFSPSQQNVFSRFYNKLEIASAQLIEDFARKRYSGDKLSIFHPDYWKVILFKNFNGDPFSQAQAYGEHQRLMNNERTKAIANTPLGTNLSVDYLVNKLSITDKNQYEWLNANPQKAINYEKLIKDYKNNSIGGEFGNTLVGDLNLSNGNDTDFVNLGDPTDFVTEAIINGGLVQEMIKELNIIGVEKQWLYNNPNEANKLRILANEINDNTQFTINSIINGFINGKFKIDNSLSINNTISFNSFSEVQDFINQLTNFQNQKEKNNINRERIINFKQNFANVFTVKLNVDVKCTLDNFRTQEDEYKLENVDVYLTGLTTFVELKQGEHITERNGGVETVIIKNKLITGLNIKGFPFSYTENLTVGVEFDRRTGEAFDIKIHIE